MKIKYKKDNEFSESSKQPKTWKQMGKRERKKYINEVIAMNIFGWEHDESAEFGDEKDFEEMNDMLHKQCNFVENALKTKNRYIKEVIIVSNKYSKMDQLPDY